MFVGDQNLSGNGGPICSKNNTNTPAGFVENVMKVFHVRKAVV